MSDFCATLPLVNKWRKRKMPTLISIRPGASTQKKPKPAQPTKRPTLADAPGVMVNDGRTIEWAHGGGTNDLTAQEIDAIKKKTGHKSVNVVRAIQIKRLMISKSYVQMVKHLSGKKGYSARTIWSVYSALKSVGEPIM